MKGLLPVVLYLVAGVAQAQSAGELARRTGEALPLPAPSSAVRLEKAPEPRPVANLALTITDDADSVRLPPMASRSTPQPTRLIVVGIEFTF